MNNKITNVELAYYDDNNSTVIVTVELNDKEESFHVQTADGLYRPDLGCWMTTSYSEGPIEPDDYENYDLDLISKEAENFLENLSEIKDTSNNDYRIKVYDDRVDVLMRNHNFVNADTSSYQMEHTFIETFDDEESALIFVKSL